MTRPTTLFALACVAACLAGAAGAQTYPTKPIRMVVGFAPGGSTDKLARVLSQAMSEILGQTVTVDNRPGAAGNIAAEAVATAPADGYTVFMATVSSQAINPHLYPNTRFHPLDSFEPVMLVAKYPLVLMVPPGSPVDGVPGFVDFARRQSGKLYFSSAGTGSPGHLAGEIFKQDVKVEATHVPYKGGGPAMLAVMADEVQFAFETIPSAISLVRSGKLKGIAVTSDRRSSAAPDLPTMQEGGVKGISVTSWAGLVAPARTPRPVLDRLGEATRLALQKPGVRSALAADGAEPGGGTAAEFARFMASELRSWGQVVKNAGTKLD
ncbi:tripartite tricarboxylate transporter substrate binding protein [Piscinibacter sakaiensis]|uniref:Putative exported protein n=1 Tax=Piscinibacter sakaiensis TaxID=1547922 RepID=A0A0K8NU26_PISS1|nr:tripartite tricarboxylate transporter substrate binding protein [Piscinibacter sakaiensis]GAP33892.1 putative exported protein [Piscinibacter sakaiensis]